MAHPAERSLSGAPSEVLACTPPINNLNRPGSCSDSNGSREARFGMTSRQQGLSGTVQRGLTPLAPRRLPPCGATELYFSSSADHSRAQGHKRPHVRQVPRTDRRLRTGGLPTYQAEADIASRGSACGDHPLERLSQFPQRWNASRSVWGGVEPARQRYRTGGPRERVGAV